MLNTNNAGFCDRPMKGKLNRYLCAILHAASGAAVLLILTAGAAAEEFPVRAPSALPGTTVEMNDPEFWIGRIDDPDRVIIPASELDRFNRSNLSRTAGAGHPYADNIARIEKDGPVLNRMNPLGLGESFDGVVVRARLDETISRLTGKTLYDRWALPFTDEKKAEIIDAMNMDALPGTIRPEMAMIVRHTSARLYPTAEPGYAMRNYLDDINVTSLDIGMPAAVMHRSKTGDYLFVITPIAWGWVPAKDMAFSLERTIRDYLNMERFVVITGHKLSFFADEKYTVHAGYLYMGERLPVTGKRGDGYSVTVPVRSFDGALMFEKGWIRSGDTVHEGWLPYTKRNVITTAFRLLGRPYGWHDSWDERDCGGIMRVIFGCFGIELPRYWSFQQLCSDHAAFVGDIADMVEKNSKLGSMPAGITFIGTTGHIGLYLGSVDGKPYGLHECGWNYKRDGAEYKMARVVVSDFENIGFNMKDLKYFTPVMP